MVSPTRTQYSLPLLPARGHRSLHPISALGSAGGKNSGHDNGSNPAKGGSGRLSKSATSLLAPQKPTAPDETT